MTARREPGNAQVFDLFKNSDGQPSQRLKKIESEGKDSKTVKRWQVRWNDNEGRQKSRAFRRQVDAKKYRDEITTQLRRGDYIDAKLGQTTVAAIYDRWEPTTVHNADKTRYDRRGAWKKHVSVKWGSREVATITKADVQAWVAELHDSGAGQSLINRCLEVLRLILNFAVDDGLLRANPATAIKVPHAPKNERHYLTVKQVEALSTAAGGDYKTLVRVLAYCGLRWGEATALRARDVDTERGRIEVSKAFTTVGGKRIEKDTKTHERRTVPFPDALREDLKQLVAQRRLGGYLFITESGTPLNPSNFRNRVWLDALSNAGLALGDPLPAITVHDLRHTAASLAISAGANVKALQRILGHASAAMTLDRYADLLDDDLGDVAVRMNDLIVCETSVKSGNK